MEKRIGNFEEFLNEMKYADQGEIKMQTLVNKDISWDGYLSTFFRDAILKYFLGLDPRKEWYSRLDKKYANLDVEWTQDNNVIKTLDRRTTLDSAANRRGGYVTVYQMRPNYVGILVEDNDSMGYQILYGFDTNDVLK